MSAALWASIAACDGAATVLTTRFPCLSVATWKDVAPGASVMRSSCVRVRDISTNGEDGVDSFTRFQVAATLPSVMTMNLLSYCDESDAVPVMPTGGPSPSSAERDDRWKSMT